MPTVPSTAKFATENHTPQSTMIPVARKIIHALCQYTPQGPDELAFLPGTYFYVVAEPQNRGGWYEACHPMSSARGLVPKSCFKEFQVSDIMAAAKLAAANALTTARDDASTPSSDTNSVLEVSPPPPPPPVQIIEYTTSTEDIDELLAATTPPSHHLSVTEEDNHPDFPLRFTLDFVDLQSPTSDDEPLTFGDLSKIIARGGLPTVDDWKRVSRGTGRRAAAANDSDYDDDEDEEQLLTTDIYADESETETEGSDSSGPSTASIYSMQSATTESIILNDMREGNDVFHSTALLLSDIQEITSDTTGSPAQSPSSTAGTFDIHHLPPQGNPDTTPLSVDIPPSDTSNSGHSTPTQPRPTMAFTPSASYQDLHCITPTSPPPSRASNTLPSGLLISAKIIAVECHDEQNWFKIRAVYLPDGESSAARRLVIFRAYEDFYDFQLMLMDAFPVEAGRQQGPHQTVCTRKLPFLPIPFMPRPLESGGEFEDINHADAADAALEQLRIALDDYLDQLCELAEIHAEHILRHESVRWFFSPRQQNTEAAFVCDQVESPSVEEVNNSDGKSTVEESTEETDNEESTSAHQNNQDSAESAREEHRRQEHWPEEDHPPHDTVDPIDVLAALSLGPNTSRNGHGLSRYSTAYWTSMLRHRTSSSSLSSAGLESLEDLRYLSVLEEERRWAEERSRRGTVGAIVGGGGGGHHPYSGGSRLLGDDNDNEPLFPLHVDIEGIKASVSSQNSPIKDGLCVVCQDQLASMAVIDCGHLALCKSCSEMIMTSTQECPLCRTFIVSEDRLLRIFKT